MLDPDVFEHRSTQGILLQERSVGERGKFHYYLAQTYAQAGRNDLALQYIRKALEEGFKEKKKFQEDPAFAGLEGAAGVQRIDGERAACSVSAANRWSSLTISFILMHHWGRVCPGGGCCRRAAGGDADRESEFRRAIGLVQPRRGGGGGVRSGRREEDFRQARGIAFGAQCHASIAAARGIFLRSERTRIGIRATIEDL